jgi:hypothetical protein
MHAMAGRRCASRDGDMLQTGGTEPRGRWIVRGLPAVTARSAGLASRSVIIDCADANQRSHNGEWTEVCQAPRKREYGGAYGVVDVRMLVSRCLCLRKENPERKRLKHENPGITATERDAPRDTSLCVLVLVSSCLQYCSANTPPRLQNKCAELTIKYWV